MYRIFSLLIVLMLLAVAFACTGQKTPAADSPTEAYKRLYVAVKSKEIEAIKKNITKKTVEFGAMAAQRYGTGPEKMYENGFTATTFSETLPSIRDERIKEKMGAIEVWNSKESKWEDLPFMLEDGSWKLAMGEHFAGSYQLPSKGRDQIEREAANAMSNMPLVPRSNADPTRIANSSAPPATNAK